MYGRDIEVYERKSAMTAAITYTTLNGPADTEPIRLLKEKEGVFNLIIKAC